MANPEPRIYAKRTKYNDQQKSDVASISQALLTQPEKLSPLLTFLGGKEDQRFPLSMLTEGVGNVRSIEQLEYEYDVMTRLRKTRPLAVTPSNTSDLGKGGTLFKLTFPDKWFIKDYILVSKTGVQARIMSEPTPNGSNWDYQVRLVSPDPSATMPASDVQAGSQFGSLFAAVGLDWSRGNASNWEAPARIRHKLTTIRKSYQMSGNAKHTVMEIGLPTKSGGTSKYWIDFEEWQYMLQWKEECEMYYWYGEQSYNEKGVTNMLDENGQPVIIGPGLLEQIQNKETYSVLTTEKIKNVVRDIFYGMTDGQNKQVTLYTGIGGADEFDTAMKTEVGATNYRQFNDGKFVSGSGRNLSLTGFFTTYEHIDGHVVRVVKVPLFDHGAVAQASRKHPRSGLPLESYRMVFVDQSNYNGEPNLQMVTRKNRELLRWAVAGSTIPQGYPGNDLRATDIDGCSVHFLKVAGIVLKRFDTSLDMRCVIA
ncbi:hypothetical protein [Natronospira sp.]|uniref:hypothetical protein n=1 Tax=Natronospira sp. TaxID=2024970 RepID=UPI0038736A20